MTELGKGQNVAVGGGRISVELRHGGHPVDLSALLVGADGKVRSDDDMVFYNQPSAESGAVRHLAAGAGQPERIEVDPAGLPAEVDRVVLVGSCDPDDRTQTFREVRELTVRAVQGGAEPIGFRPPALTDGERALLLLEVYRRGTGWKVRAIGQGYAEGLEGLATDFGVRVDDPEPDPEPEARPRIQPSPSPSLSPSPTPPPPPRSPTPPPPSLVKAPLGSISLDKGGHASISLDKQDRELVVTASLEWDGGSDKRRQMGADLDLYALFVPASKALRGPKSPGTLVKSGHRPQGDPLLPGGAGGTGKAKKGKGGDVVYYKNLGALDQPPFIRLDGDSQAPGSESVRIVRPDEHGYVLLCAYSAVSNGFGSFRSFGAKVVITDGRGSTVTVPLFENTKTRYWVAIALVDFTAPDGAAVQHIEAYSSRMTERRPVLHPDGAIEMNGGPVEFKRH